MFSLCNKLFSAISLTLPKQPSLQIQIQMQMQTQTLLGHSLSNTVLLNSHLVCDKNLDKIFRNISVFLFLFLKILELSDMSETIFSNFIPPTWLSPVSSN
jgi:hypothetical protein